MPRPAVSSGPTQVDFLSSNGRGFTGHGPVAMRLLQSGFRVEALRPNGVLRKDEWIQLDTSIIEQARLRLRGVGDLLSRGLRFPLRNALGTTRLEWERVGTMTPANIDMSAITEGDNDRLLFDLQSIPIPIIHKDFHINIRVLEASRTRGEPLDTMQSAMAARLVAERLEALLFNGGYSVGTNGTIYGYTNAPQRNTGSVSATWLTATGAQIVFDVLAMINKARADFMFGPYVLYVPSAVYVHLGDDYKTESDRTILERVLAIPGVSAVMDSDNLTGTNILLVQMTSDVVDIIDGMQPTVVQWETVGGMQLNFKVMTIMVPRMKSDYAGQSGLVHYS